MARIEDPQKDPFGQAMLDYLATGKNRRIRVESDIAIDDIIPVAYLFRTWEDMPLWEQTALNACRGRVLDIGAGAGSHGIALQDKGHAVVGMDISPGAVETMIRRGVQHAWHADFFDHPPQEFDTLLLMMNGIGIVGNLSRLNTFLEQAKNWLSPAGQIVLDSSDISYLYDEEDLFSIPQDRYKGIIQFRMMYQKTVSDPFWWLYLDFPRLQQHAEMAGYRCECLIEGPHYEYVARLTRS